MMSSSPAAGYFRWLRGLVDGQSSHLDYFFHILWETKYSFVVPLDINRALDGKVLRKHYEAETATTLPLLGDCSMLEFLVALAKRLNEAEYDWENPDQIDYWFWVLIGNLGIEDIDDSVLRATGRGEIDHILAKLIHNDFAPDGSEGGLFPLRNAPGDMRVTEVWYQMQRYLMEME